MARVTYLTPETAPPAVASTLGKMPPLHVFRMLAHAETAFRPWLKFGGAILADLAIDPLLRELVILQVGRLAARYEWEQHVPIALAAGGTAEQIEALDRDELGTFDPGTRAALEFTAALVRDGEVSDENYAALAAEFSEREIVEIALTAAHYLGLARIMTALRIDPDAPAGPDGLPAARVERPSAG
ncbi:carboxymuconolactone decarboxylase family protein [Pseudonocardia sp. NPDC049154]|uniref:carboxymuconolactone decarboxylase family protein n=1 Tax=Pseudonocardia sp. NPDC049154 TaxID=3155501 RepID=UPI0033C3B34C